MVVVEEPKSHRIVATGSLLVEPKFIHQGVFYAACPHPNSFRPNSTHDCSRFGRPRRGLCSGGDAPGTRPRADGGGEPEATREGNRLLQGNDDSAPSTMPQSRNRNKSSIFRLSAKCSGVKRKKSSHVHGFIAVYLGLLGAQRGFL